jgi:hypothetical protein
MEKCINLTMYQCVNETRRMYERMERSDFTHMANRDLTALDFWCDDLNASNGVEKLIVVNFFTNLNNKRLKLSLT